MIEQIEIHDYYYYECVYVYVEFIGAVISCTCRKWIEL